MSACVHIHIHRQMFVRPETIDRPTHERPSNKTFFSLCDVCITNCLASTIFFSIVILIPVRFPSTDHTECERIHQQATTARKVNYFAINLFLQTWPLDATREAFTSEFISECERFIEFSLEILENTLRCDNNLYRTWRLRLIRSEIYISS